MLPPSSANINSSILILATFGIFSAGFNVSIDISHADLAQPVSNNASTIKYLTVNP